MIKTFITRFCVFVGIGLIALSGVSLLHRSFMTVMLQPEHLSVGHNTDVIIMGDSHTQTGIDEQLLTHAVNISANSMHYMYSYLILKALLKSNPQVKAVVLGYSYHNLNEYYEGFLRDEKQARFKLNDYYWLFEREQENVVRTHSLAFYEAYAKYHFGLPIQLAIRLYVKSIMGKLTARDFPFWGKTYKREHSNISKESLIMTIQRHFFSPDLKSPQKHSDLQKVYLAKIVDLCRQRGVRLYLLMTPLHPSYRVNIPGDFIRDFGWFTADLKSMDPGLGVWDHSGDVFADFMYGDADHLNVYGAKIFSRVINRRLEDMRAQGFR